MEKGLSRLSQSRDDSPGELVLALGTVGGVGVHTHGVVSPCPPVGIELPQVTRSTALILTTSFHFEVLTDAVPQVLVGGAGEAVHARIGCSPGRR